MKRDAAFSPTFFEERFPEGVKRPRKPDEKKVVAVDPLESREPDRGAWIGEGDGEVDYQ
ncbi:hypothetical protein [Halosimplex pelagicum]|uniref:hypothetical protein n=1 Tax=Halosimplex pelagicum TaxID=869886 RepID=UPI003CCDB2FB